MSVSHDFGEWAVESLRLTIFHPTREPSSGLWGELRGTKPESIEDRPRDHIVVEHGDVDGDRLVLVSGTERQDWNIRPTAPAPNEPRAGPLTLSTTGQTSPLSLIRGALDVSLPRLRQVDRLALGAVLIQLCPDLLNGLSVLSKYLPRLELETHGDRDISYRINRRRRLNAPNVEFNRVATWSLEESYSGSVQLAPNRPPVVRSTATPSVYCKLILDINTVPSPSVFSVKRVPALFTECVKFAREIAVEGDV